MKEDYLFFEPLETHRDMYRRVMESYDVDGCVPEEVGENISEVENYDVVVTEFDYFDQVLEEKDETTDVILYTCRDLCGEKLPIEENKDFFPSFSKFNEEMFAKTAPEGVKMRIKGHTNFSDLLNEDLDLEYLGSKKYDGAVAQD